ncbi:MAG: hypothetical protein C0485_09920 [Pirellula sp.]|nr:hypothetical protein [Pirellula sp.]
MDEFQQKSLYATRLTAWTGFALAIIGWLTLQDGIKTNLATLQQLDATLNRMDRERSDSIRPHVGFNVGNFKVELGPANAVKAKKGELGSTRPYLFARNVGNGSAVNAEIEWKPTLVWTTRNFNAPDETVSLASDRSSLDPTMVAAKESCGTFSLPQFILDDHEKHDIWAVRGLLIVHCKDLAGVSYASSQDFEIVLSYDAKPPTAIIRVKPLSSPDLWPSEPLRMFAD